MGKRSGLLFRAYEKSHTMLSCAPISCADFTERRIEVDDKSSVVWGRRVGSRLIRLPRLLDEDPMGKPVAHPQKMATASQWLAIGPSAHPQTKVAEEVCGEDLK